MPSGSLKFFHGNDDPDEKKGGYTTVSITPTIMNVTFYSHKGRPVISFPGFLLAGNERDRPDGQSTLWCTEYSSLVLLCG